MQICSRYSIFLSAFSPLPIPKNRCRWQERMKSGIFTTVDRDYLYSAFGVLSKPRTSEPHHHLKGMLVLLYGYLIKPNPGSKSKEK